MGAPGPLELLICVVVLLTVALTVGVFYVTIAAFRRIFFKFDQILQELERVNRRLSQMEEARHGQDGNGAQVDIDGHR